MVLIKSFEDRCNRHHVPISSSETQSILSDALCRIRPKVCCEIGTAVGRGSFHIASQIAQRNGYLFSFDVSFPRYHIAQSFLYQQEIRNITCYNFDIITAPLSKIFSQSIDFCFIDGAKGQYNQYYKTLSPFLSQCNAVLIFDDMQWYHDNIGESTALKEMLIHDGRTLTIKKSEANDRTLIAIR